MMRFKSQRYTSKMPTVDLIPMLNVMMAVLAFFVLVSMSLTTEPEGVDVKLPSPEEAEAAQAPGTPDPLIVKLGAEGSIFIGDRPLNDQELVLQQVQGYLAQNPQGSVILVAEPEANYETVVRLLAEMRTIGGDRVSLGLEGN